MVIDLQVYVDQNNTKTQEKLTIEEWILEVL